MIFSPTIVNDGRRLLISSQNLSFMIGDNKETTYENIDFQSFFKNNDPHHMRFSSVLRASATFPMIMPMMALPTKPEISSWMQVFEIITEVKFLSTIYSL